jgi:integrase/recombinase XerD
MFMSDPLRVRMSGPLSVFAAGLLEELLGCGYRPGTATKQLQPMAYLSRWMAERDLEPGALRGVEIERFVQDRRASGRVQLSSARALVPLLRYLGDLAGVPAAASREAPTPAGGLLDRYADYLQVEPGLAAETVRGYCNTARALPADRERIVGDLALGALDAAAINDYLLGRSRRGSIASSGAVVTGCGPARFLHVEGLIDRDFAVAVASVATWRLASLVKALDGPSVARLLGRCDQGTAVGRRDFAILLLLSRLGLRIGEAAALRLDDLRLARGRARRLWQGQPPGAAAAPGRRRRGNRRLAAARATRLSEPVRWATTPTGVGHAYLAQRMRAARGFACYLHGIDQATEIPPLELLPTRRHRPTPHIYSDGGIAALMTAARTLRPALRAATIETLIGLLACTGLRVGEAFALDRADIDTDNRLLRIRDSKFGKSREVLIHSTLPALNAYLAHRDRLRPGGDRVCVFVSS